ncbi:MAG: ABC transporter permease, partial [Planctomycetota bacterium]|nr:ABC transporter permease [Planctomycetota bacterium]
GLTTVIVLVLVVVGFIRGLEKTLEVSGDPQTAIFFAMGMGENLEYSSIPMRSAELVASSNRGIQKHYGQKYVSPELYLGTQVKIPSTGETGYRETLGLVRGVTDPVLLVRNQIEIETGHWPEANQVIVGKLAAAKLGIPAQSLRIGKTILMENREWEIVGQFSGGGSALESEIWCRLDDLQQAMKRQDLSLVALSLSPEGDFADLELFCKQRLDLELQMMPETRYYDLLQRDYRPVRWLAWLVVSLVIGSGLFAGLNTMYGAVVGRIAELSMLRTVGFGRRAIAISLVQEGMILSISASLIACVLAITWINGIAVQFTMGAFQLEIDHLTILIGCLVGMVLGILGAIPPALKAFNLQIVEGIRTV